MKRWALCCIMALVFAFSSLAAAEGAMDFSQYTLEELIKLRAALEEEISGRTGSTTAILNPGMYTTGVDIAEGSYILIGLMDKGPDGYTPQALYAETMGKATSWDYIGYSYMKEGKEWRITLQNGMVLEVRSGNVSIQKAAPLLFAP